MYNSSKHHHHWPLKHLFQMFYVTSLEKSTLSFVAKKTRRPIIIDNYFKYISNIILNTSIQHHYHFH